MVLKNYLCTSGALSSIRSQSILSANSRKAKLGEKSQKNPSMSRSKQVPQVAQSQVTDGEISVGLISRCTTQNKQ